MNSIETISNKQIGLFVLCVFFATLLTGVGSFLALKSTQVSEVNTPPMMQSACMSFLKAQGFQPTVEANSLRVHHNSNQQMEEVVNKAGLAIAFCAEHQLEQFCAGLECEPNGVSFTLGLKP